MERVPTPKWTDLSEFPAAPGEWSSYYPLLFTSIDGENRARRHIKTAAPTVPVLLSSPSSNRRYLPPLLLDPRAVSRKLTRDARTLRDVTMAMTVLGTGAFYLATDLLGAAHFFLVFSIIAFYMAFYYRLAQSEDALSERAKFYGWCFSNPPIYSYGYIVVMVLAGMIQLLGSGMYGSEEAFKLEFGLVYSTLEASGEWWRLVTAPLLHNGTSHWLINTFVGAGLLLVYGPVLRLRVLWLIATLAPVSFFCVYAVERLISLDSEGIVGISGGIAGIVGYFLAANVRHPGSFPRHFFVTTLFVALSTLIMVSFVTSTTSFIAHLAGFLVGLALGFVTNPVSDHFYQQRE